MRRFGTPLLLLALCASCANSPTRRYVQYEDALALANKTTAAAVRNKDIEVDDAKELRVVLRVIGKRLDEFRSAIARGEDRKALHVLLDTVNDALAEFARRLAMARDKRAVKETA